jgi:hypothetical protein
MEMLDRDSIEILHALFLELSPQPKGVNAVRFRAHHDDRIDKIETLVNSGWIERQGGTYLPKLLALVQVASIDRDAERILSHCRQIFGHLRDLYKRDPEHPIAIDHFAIAVDIAAEGVRKALPYLQRGLSLLVVSGDLDSDTAMVIVPEQVLQYKTFDDVLDQYRRWAQGPERLSQEGSASSTSSTLRGSAWRWTPTLRRRCKPRFRRDRPRPCQSVGE